METRCAWRDHPVGALARRDINGAIQLLNRKKKADL
jgi:hypothetical protein